MREERLLVLCEERPNKFIGLEGVREGVVEMGFDRIAACGEGDGLGEELQDIANK